MGFRVFKTPPPPTTTVSIQHHREGQGVVVAVGAVEGEGERRRPRRMGAATVSPSPSPDGQPPRPSRSRAQVCDGTFPELWFAWVGRGWMRCTLGLGDVREQSTCQPRRDVLGRPDEFFSLRVVPARSRLICFWRLVSGDTRHRHNIDVVPLLLVVIAGSWTAENLEDSTHAGRLRSRFQSENNSARAGNIPCVHCHNLHSCVHDGTSFFETLQNVQQLAYANPFAKDHT